MPAIKSPPETYAAARGRRTRLKDIADALGLAVITVSKGLRNHSDIRRETREKILAKAQEMHYTPNFAARSLVTQRSYVVGVVVPDLMISYFAEVAKVIAGELRQSGYDILLSNSEGDPATETREIERLLGRQVDGLIVATSFPASEKSPFDDLAARDIPLVLLDRSIHPLPASFVGTNDRVVGELATSHLIAVGCRRIAHLRGPETSTGVGRLAGYRRTLLRAGGKLAPEMVEPGDSSVEEGFAGMMRLLGRPARPDGVFCYNDLVAAGALRACVTAAVRVPGDVAIIGCGNHHMTDLLIVPLSTVDQQTARIGRETARTLLAQINDEKPPHARRLLVPPRLIVRDSTRR